MSPQAVTVAAPKRIPLVTTFGNRDEGLTKGPRLVNCFAEKDLSTGDYFVQKRIGLGIKQALSGAGLGMYNWNGDLYSIFGNKLYKNGVELGLVNGTGGRYFFVQVRGLPERLVFGNGQDMYYLEGDTILQIPSHTIVHAGSFVVGSDYTIVDVGDTDWLACGASSVPGSGTPVKDGNFVIGTSYVINYLGTIYKAAGIRFDLRSDFTLVGASSNTIGVMFTATGVGNSLKDGTAVPTIPAGSGDTFTATTAGFGTGIAALNVTSLVPGESYQIYQVGTTDFTLVGAPYNTVGTTFVATGPGTGTGNVMVQNTFPDVFCKGFVYLDGTLYVMDQDGVIWGSKDLDDPTVWDPLNKIVARVEPDGGVALAKQLVYVIALKEWTTEVFYDAGNFPGSPLAPVQGAKSPYGCVSADSIQEIDDVLYWMSSNRTVSPQIVCMQDLKVRVISTPAVDRLLERADFSNIFSWTFKHGGHKFYGVTITNINLTLVYDIDQELWYQWTDHLGNYWPIVFMNFDEDNEHVAQHETNGKLYYFEGDYEYHDDDGDIFPVDIFTPLTDFGVDRRKTVNQMHFVGDTVSGSTLQVRVSDDDYQNWSPARTVDLGHKRPILSQCGTFYRRAWWFRHQASKRFRMRSVDLQMDIGTL